MAREAELGRDKEQASQGVSQVQIKKDVVTIGQAGWSVTKTRDPISRQDGLFFTMEYPEIAHGVTPRVRFMSAYEQKIEEPDKNYQYLIFAAEPYDNSGFKLQSRELDRREGKYWSWFDEDSKVFFLQITFKSDRDERFSGVPGLAPGGSRR